MAMPGRFFSFHLSGYESYLAENIAKSAKVMQSQEHFMFGEGLRIVCGNDGESVVVDRLLLVLLHPYYREILRNKDTSLIILPELSIADLTADFFGVLMRFCNNFVESQTTLKKEQNMEIDKEKSVYETVEESSDFMTYDFEENEKKYFEERQNMNLNSNTAEYICLDEEDNVEESTEDMGPPNCSTDIFFFF